MILLEIKNDIPGHASLTGVPPCVLTVPSYKIKLDGLRRSVIRDLFLPVMVDGQKKILCFGGNQYLSLEMIPLIKDGMTEQSMYDLRANVRLSPTNEDCMFYAATEFYLESIQICISTSNITSLIHLHRDMVQKPWIRGNINFQNEKEEYLTSLRPLTILMNQSYSRMYTERVPSSREEINLLTTSWLDKSRAAILKGSKVSLIKHVIIKSERDHQVGLKFNLAEGKIADYCMMVPPKSPAIRKEMISVRVKGVFCFNQFGTDSLSNMIVHAMSMTPSKQVQPLHIKAALICVNLHNIVDVTRLIPDAKMMMTLPNNGNYLSLEKLYHCDCIVASEITCSWETRSSKRQDLVEANLPIMTSSDEPGVIFGPQSIALSLDDPRLSDPMFRSRIYVHREHIIKLLTFDGGMYVHDHADLCRWFTRYLMIKVRYRVAFLPQTDSMNIVKASRWILDETVASFSMITPTHFIPDHILKVVDSFRSHVFHYPIHVRPASTEQPISPHSMHRTYPALRATMYLPTVPKMKSATMLQNMGRFVEPVAAWIEEQHRNCLARFVHEESMLSEAVDPEMIAYIRQQMVQCMDDAKKWEHMIAHIHQVKPFVQEQCQRLERVDPDMTCSICLSRVRDPVMNAACGHVQCTMCMHMALRTQTNCPQCRVPICGSLIKVDVPNMPADRYCVEAFGSKMIEMIKIVESAPGATFVIVKDVGLRIEVTKALSAHHIRSGITLASDKYPENIKVVVLTHEDCTVDIELSHLGSTIVLMEPFSSLSTYSQLIGSIVGKCLHNPMVKVYHLLMKGSEDEVLFQAYCKQGQKRKREEIKQ